MCLWVYVCRNLSFQHMVIKSWGMQGGGGIGGWLVWICLLLLLLNSKLSASTPPPLARWFHHLSKKKVQKKTTIKPFVTYFPNKENSLLNVWDGESFIHPKGGREVSITCQRQRDCRFLYEPSPVYECLHVSWRPDFFTLNEWYRCRCSTWDLSLFFCHQNTDSPRLQSITFISYGTAGILWCQMTWSSDSDPQWQWQ